MALHAWAELGATDLCEQLEAGYRDSLAEIKALKEECRKAGLFEAPTGELTGNAVEDRLLRVSATARTDRARGRGHA